MQHYIKNTILLPAFMLAFVHLFAQKTEYKDGLIKTDGKEIARVIKIKDKENIGLTSTYELHSLKGEKLIIATIATEFEEARNDNSSYYYRFTFLTANQVGIFALSKLGPEKSFAKLIGQSGIVVNDSIDDQRLAELIASRGRSPRRIQEYRIVQRNFSFPVFIQDNNTVLQGTTDIGQYRDVSNRPDLDTYEFSLPSGLVIAWVSFRGGNNAQNFMVNTAKDNRTQAVKLPPDGTYGRIHTAVDRNLFALERIAKWLVAQRYL